MTDSAIAIRIATLRDVAAIANVGARAFRTAYGPHASRDDIESHIHEFFAADAVRTEIELQASRYLLASVDNRAGGIAKYRHAPCPVPGGDANAFELQQLYVLNDMQGHGLGRSLVTAVTDAARRESANGVWLSAWDFADWAIGFYNNVGFATIGQVEFRLGDTVQQDQLMWRSLT